MKDLSVIIVNYNTQEFLKNCLLSVFETTPKNLNLEVIVSDNNSLDGSGAMVKKEFPKVVLVENKENFGFSKANNIGIKKARGRYILFLNSDTVVYPKTLQKMIEFMDQNEKAGVATCKVVMPNGKLDDACHRGFPTPVNSFFHFSGVSKFVPIKLTSGYSLNYLNFNETHEIDACAGAFMIVRREAGEEIGWWDEDFFWYGEDLDFCYRLKKKGWKVYFVPEVSILHYKGVSGGIKSSSAHLTKADSQTKKLATKARFEAMRIFYKKHYQNNYSFPVNWLVYRGIGLRQSLSSIGL